MTNDMTIREIAEVANVSEATVRNWAAKTAGSALITAKIADCRGKEAARLTLDETLAIIRAGGKATLANLLAENAAKRPAAAPKLPNGTQLRELNRMAERRILSPYQVQLVLGVAVPRATPLPEVPATEAEALEGFARVRAAFGQKSLPGPVAAASMKAAAAAYDATAHRLQSRAEADALQGRLM